MKKALNIIKNILVWLVVIVAVAMMIFTIVSVTTFNRNDRNLFGYRTYIVNSDSMAATDFKAGDLIFVKETPARELKEGDIIAFISQDEQSFGEIVTHKIRSVYVDGSGNPSFITYGTTTNTDDTTPVNEPYIMGKYQFHFAAIGNFFNFLKTPQGYIVCIFVPFMLLILYQGINCIRLFRRYKKEQTEEMEAEKAAIEAERAETAKMMEELMALKAQLDGKAAEPAAAPTETPAEAPAETPEEAPVE